MSNNVLIELDQIPISYFYTQPNFDHFKPQFTQFKNFVTTKKHLTNPPLAQLAPVLEQLVKALPEAPQRTLLANALIYAQKVTILRENSPEIQLSTPKIYGEDQFLDDLLIDRFGRSNSNPSTPTPMATKKAVQHQKTPFAPSPNEAQISPIGPSLAAVKNCKNCKNGFANASQMPARALCKAPQQQKSIEELMRWQARMQIVNSLLLVAVLVVLVADRLL
ncbi:hypothetical protein SS50377_23964 [Spironucleus salmonicida]|uniref:Uncharacterized protein n=1 Tax=Spironucleus salmonicida TaxID=348837 RepID=V6LEI8_9EUKA|nr:hypothetical protein SS50377_23964 [Spironucleus salmonicida]|eukprot:EST42930.1 Hypothetical protein SS50377_17462 [Spironucleus salmonicida]